MSAAASTGNQVLEFRLGEETYCVSIDHVAEIVDAAELTPVPNAGSHVKGVMDLRGRTTSIVDPKTVFGIESDGDATAEGRIVVFDSGIVEDGAAGWLVDEVEQVVGVSADRVDAAPGDDGSVRGIVRREDGFVVWVDPAVVHA